MDPLSEVLALLKPQALLLRRLCDHGRYGHPLSEASGNQVLRHARRPVLVGGRRRDRSRCCSTPETAFCSHADFRSGSPPTSRSNRSYTVAWARLGMTSEAPGVTEGARYIAGGHFALTGGHAEMILHSLPPIVHIRRESDKAAMRWSLERMREELRDPQPGGR